MAMYALQQIHLLIGEINTNLTVSHEQVNLMFFFVV